MNFLKGDQSLPSLEDEQLSQNFAYETNNQYVKTEQTYSTPAFLDEHIEVIELQNPKSIPSIAFSVSSQLIKEAQIWGEQKLKQTLWTTLMLSILAGVFISMGCLFSQRLCSQLTHTLEYNTEIRIRKEGIGAQNCLMGMMFAAGVTITILVNGEYFTANLFMFVPAIIHQTASIKTVLKFDILCLIGNIFGALIFAWVVGYWTVNLNEEGLEVLIAKMAEERMIKGFGVQFIKGIGYAWVMGQGMLIYISARSIFSKAFGLWVSFFLLIIYTNIVFNIWSCFNGVRIFNIFTLRYEDVVQNIYFMTSGIMCKANITFGDYIGYSFLPQLLGHFISSHFLIGLYYCYLYHWPQKYNKQK